MDELQPVKLISTAIVLLAFSMTANGYFAPTGDYTGGYPSVTFTPFGPLWYWIPVQQEFKWKEGR